MKPSYYIVKDEPTGNSIRFFVIGYFINSKFTGMLHDYTGGGCYGQALVVNDQFLPFEVDSEPTEWDESINLFDELSPIPFHQLEEHIHAVVDYDIKQWNYVILPEFDHDLINDLVYIDNCTTRIPYGLGNTSFPVDGYEIDTME